MKSDSAKSFIVHMWLKAQGLRYWMSTNECHHSPSEAASDALDFMQEIRKKVSETYHEKNCFNIDQTPVFFTFHSNQTLEMKGVKTVTIITSTQDTRHATLAVTVCADGTKLPLMLISKVN